MNNIIRTTKFFTLLFFFTFLFVGQVSAQNLVDIDFETTPLFKNLNILPGDEMTRWVKVKNNSDETQAVAVSVAFFEDFDNLGSKMKISIGSEGDIIYEKPLSDFFSDGELYLSDVLSGVEKQYDFYVSFIVDTDNNYQGKTLNFDIIVGSQAKESIGGETSSVNGGGGSYVYGDLIISDEGVVVNDTSALITWLTNKAASSRVIYDTASHENILNEEPPLYGYQYSTAEDTTKETDHSVFITGLLPNTQYFFRPLSKASPEKYGKELYFSTSNTEEMVMVLGEEGRPELAIHKNCESQIVNPGDEVVCEVKIENSGNLTAYNVSLREVLSEGLEFLAESTNEKKWNLGKIGPKEFSSVEYLVLVKKETEDGKYSNVSFVKADNSEEISVEIDLQVKRVSVLGAEFAHTGFSNKEFGILLFLLFVFLFASWFARRKYL